MSVIDFYHVAAELGRLTDQTKRKDLLDADSFSITLTVHDANEDTRLHVCGKDEFFYVIQGELEMQVANELLPMKAGEGILVKTGVKHKRRTKKKGAWVMTITKRPHRHRSFDQSPGN